MEEFAWDVINQYNVTSYEDLGIWESIEAFSYAIDWNEQWIQAVLVFHCITLILTVLTRRFYNIQIVILTLLCKIHMLSASLNLKHEH